MPQEAKQRRLDLRSIVNRRRVLSLLSFGTGTAISAACSKPKVPQPVAQAAPEPTPETFTVMAPADPTRTPGPSPVSPQREVVLVIRQGTTVVDRTQRPTSTPAPGEELVPINLDTNSTSDAQRRTLAAVSVPITAPATPSPTPAEEVVQQDEGLSTVDPQKPIFDENGAIVNPELVRYLITGSAFNYATAYIDEKKPPRIKFNSPQEEKLIQQLTRSVKITNHAGFSELLQNPRTKGDIKEIYPGISTLAVNKETGIIYINSRSHAFIARRLRADKQLAEIAQHNPDGIQATTFVLLVRRGYDEVIDVHSSAIK